MRRMELTLLLLLSSVPVWAQTNAPFVIKTADTMTLIQEGQRIVTAAQVDDIVARVMSFDRDADGKVGRAELSERMESVLATADSSGDGALDVAEVRAAAAQPAVQTAVRGFQAGHYGFGDESGQSSRLHFEGVLADLKLADAANQQASAILVTFLDDVAARATAEFLEQMGKILTADEFAKLEAAFTPQSQFRTLVMSNPSGANAVLLLVSGGRGVGVTVPEAEKDHGLAAIDHFNQRLRLAEDADRSALLDQLHDLLTDEQRDDLRADLARRPIAKSGSMVNGFANVKQVPLNSVMSDALERLRFDTSVASEPGSGR